MLDLYLKKAVTYSWLLPGSLTFSSTNGCLPQNSCKIRESGVKYSNLPHFCACPKLGPWIPMTNVLDLFFACVQWFEKGGRWWLCFVDIGRIVDHHCWFSVYSTHFQVGDSNPKVEGQEFFYPFPVVVKRTLSQWKMF